MPLVRALNRRLSYDSLTGDATENTSAPETWPSSVDRSLRLNNAAEAEVDFTAQSEVWITFYCYFTVTIDESGEFFAIGSDTTKLFRFINDSGYKFQYWNGSAWTDIATYSISNNTLYRFDLYINMDETTGEARLDLNQVTGTPLTGDTIFTAETTVDKLTFRGIMSFGNYYSAVAISTDDLTESTVGAYALTAGSATEWTNGVAQVIDNNSATEISSNVVDAREDFTATTVEAIPGGEDVEVCANVGARGGGTFSIVHDDGSAESESSAITPASTRAVYYRTFTDDAAEIGVKKVS